MTTKEYFSQLSTFFLALLAGQILFAGISYYLVNFQGYANGNEELFDVFTLLVPLVFGGCLVLYSFYNKKLLSAAREKSTLREKMNQYRSAVIFRLALFEGPAFMALLGYLLTGKTLFAIMAGILVVIFSLYRPTPQKAIKELELKGDERIILEREEGKIS